MTRKAKQTIPAYGCRVAINTRTASIDRTTPVTSRCLFQTGLLKATMITPLIPFRIAMLIITINNVFTHGLIPVSPNRDTAPEESVPFPNAGINTSIASRASSTQQMRETYLLTNSRLSFSATVIISSGQIRSSIVTEKNRDISFNESMRMWNCICDCGKTKTVYQNHLRRGITTSCGCDFTRPHLDLTGKTYHNLTVLHEAEPIITRSGRKHYVWVCQCSCGKTTTVTTKDLTYGHVKSCGCLLKRDLTGKTIGKLTIIKEIEPALMPGGTKDRRWVCKCSCGKTITVRQQALDKGKKSCGCDQLMDLTGQTYGRLTVLREGEKKLKQRTWVCKCSCGSIVTVNQINLRSGSTKSCGCLPHSVPHIDLTGERFGMLTVVREAERKNPKRRRWLCQCDCGRLHEVDHSTLRSGTVKSCGCMQYVRNKPSPEPLVSTRGCEQ